MNKLFTDPSATGTTGACLVNSNGEITFFKFENKEWKEQFAWLKGLVEHKSVSLLVCETATYISNTSSDIRKLINLVGAIETLPCFFSNLKVETLPSDQTKRLRKKLANKQKGIAGLEFKRGVSWFYRENKISTHELDAFLIYWIWKGK